MHLIAAARSQITSHIIIGDCIFSNGRCPTLFSCADPFRESARPESPPATVPAVQSDYYNLLASLRLRTAFAPLRRAAGSCACFHIGIASEYPVCTADSPAACPLPEARVLICHTGFIAREPSPMNGTFSIVSIGLTHPFRIGICGRIRADFLFISRSRAPFLFRSGNAA